MNNKVVVVLPAFNCELTLEQTVLEIPKQFVHSIILVDDYSSDNTIDIAKKLKIEKIYTHNENLGYGANQKSCYDLAKEIDADIIIMLHPDYQYDPKLIPQILEKLHNGADVVLGSRMKKGIESIKLGMPIYKFISNRILTYIQNFVFNINLSEYHTGYRAYKRKVLEKIEYKKFRNDFIFDNQMLISIIQNKFIIDEVYCPARYNSDCSSINFIKSLKYGLGVLYYTFKGV